MTDESGEGTVATTEPGVERAIERAEEHLPAEMTTSPPGLLPGELRPHPTPVQYVLVAVVLVAITALEIAVSYTEGTLPDGLIVVLLLGMAFFKFFLVAAWYMHLRTDAPVFRRFFILGSIAAIVLYLVVLATLHGIQSGKDLVPGAVAFPSWSAHPDVWLIVGTLAAGYAIAITRLGPRLAPARPVVTRFQVVCWSLGIVAMWLASDWPIHDIAERYNYSVHMVQHLTFAMVVAPLLLLGTPAWLMRWVLQPPVVLRVVRTLARFVPALLVFNLVLVVTHWPWMVNESLNSAVVHFSLHALLFVSSLIVWLPVLSPLPEIPRLQPVLRMLYLFVWSVVPTVPASFLTFGSAPLYKFYEHVPHLFGLSTLQDQQLAGLIMKIGAGLLLWAVIAVVFFRWAAEEDRANNPRHGLAELDRELTEMGLRG